ncbi:MAG: DUF2335 domain-containing protein [Candidatus Dadabacteria bacterium]|nr:DUF2335 domain-containing protein [Candidatus Dadabacteria bacterium]
MTEVEVGAESIAIPPIETLKFCEEVAPGTVNRIFAMAEEQQKHRQGMEQSAVEGSIKAEARGQVFAFIISLVGLAGGGSLVFFGHDISGTILGGATLVGLASVFITGRRSRQKESEKE